MKSIMKFSAVFVLLFIAVVGIFSVPESGSEYFVSVLLLSKGIGLIAGYAMIKLAIVWNMIDLNEEV